MSKIFLYSIAHGMYFKQSDVSLIVPIVKAVANVHERNRLIKLEILEPSNITHMFSLNEKRDYLHIDEATGELWFKRSKWDVPKTWESFSEKLSIKSSGNNSEETTVTIILNFTPYSSVNEFCEQQMCFYDRITFNTFEDFGDNFKEKEIGMLAPKFHHRFCRNYHVEYRLLNGTLLLSYLNLIKIPEIGNSSNAINILINGTKRIILL